MIHRTKLLQSPPTAQAWKGTITWQWEDMVRKVVEKKLLLWLFLLQQETKTRAEYSHLWEMKWKVPDLLFRWRVVLWRAAIISGGGKATKHGILERNVIYLLLNDSAWPFWNTGQGEHWKRGYFGISIPLELKNWPTWEPNDVVCFPKCQLFYNKFVLTSKGACVLLHKCDHLHIIRLTTLRNTVGVDFYGHLFCRHRGLTRCANKMKGTATLYFHVLFLLLGKQHQYMKWHLNNLKQSVRKSRITQNRLWSH